jgi:hypothetical protein
MRMISGAILVLAAVQAFSSSLSIGFPNAGAAQDVLFPVSLVLAVAGLMLLVWGLWAAEFKRFPPEGER